MDQQSLLPGASPDTTPNLRSELQPRRPRREGLSDEEIAKHYSAVIEPFVLEAIESRHPRVLLETLAYYAARLADGYGTLAAGDFLRHFGNCLYRSAQIRIAEQEVAEAKEAGRKPS